MYITQVYLNHINKSETITFNLSIYLGHEIPILKYLFTKIISKKYKVGVSESLETETCMGVEKHCGNSARKTSPWGKEGLVLSPWENISVG